MGERTMTRRLRGWLVVGVLVALAAAAALHPGPAVAGVSGKTAAILQKNGFGGGLTGVVHLGLQRGPPRRRTNQDLLLAPASNMKLVTTLSALNTWGPDHRFKTELYGPDAQVSADGVLTGDLYLKGYGDPSLSTRDYQRREFGFKTASFESFAKRLKTLRVRKVMGRVLGDESYFDTVRDGPTWTPNLQLESGTLSALSGNESKEENGTRVGDPALYAARAHEAGPPGPGHQGHGGRGHRRRTRRGTAVQAAVLRTADDPAQAHGQEQRQLLRGDLHQGLRPTGAGRRQHPGRRRGVAPDARGHGPRPGLVRACRRFGPELLQPAYGRRPGVLLGAARQRRDADVFYDALAIAGEDGTLAWRMGGTAAQDNARAKTGTLAISVCLSGYVTSANGHRVGYALLLGGDPVDWYRGEVAQDASWSSCWPRRACRAARVRAARPPPARSRWRPSAAVNPTAASSSPIVQP